MIRAILISLCIFSLFTGLAVVITKDPGYILISLGNTVIEMHAWTAILLLGLPLLWWSTSRFLGLFRLIGRSRFLFFQRFRHKSEALTQTGLLHFLEEDWPGAKRAFLRASEGAKAPVITTLAAAKAAHEAKDTEGRNSLLKQAETQAQTPQHTIAVHLSQAQFFYDDADYESALAALNRAQAINPHHPAVLTLLQKVYVALSDWQGLQHILPELKKRKIIDTDGFFNLEQMVYSELVRKSGQDALSHRDTGLETLNATWNIIPKPQKKSPAIIALYAKFLISLEAFETAEVLIRKSLNQTWDDHLAILYSTLNFDVEQQLKTATEWSNKIDTSAALFLVLGRLSLSVQDWDAARNYFLQALAIEESPHIFSELGRLYAHQGKDQESRQYYEKGLSMLTPDLPTLPMPSPLSLSTSSG